MIDGIVSAIVRPPRAKYSSLDLGPSRIRHRGIEYIREDFNLTNARGLKLSGSVWCLMNPKQGNPESCILYLHPNSGSRVDVVRTRIMSIAANAKCTVCGFDFSGCGESEGDCVSLGVREKEDVCAVMSYLFSRGCTKFVLWGRSMGAATAAMFYGAYKELLVGTVVALILDSPFTSMQGLASEYTSSRVAVPGLLISPAVHYLRHSILTQYGFDIFLISPVAASARVNIPTIVLSGSEDKIVPPALSEELYDALGGPKMRIFFKGGHNTHRPAAIYEAVRVVLVGALRGLSSGEILRMSADILKNEVIGVSNSLESRVGSDSVAVSGGAKVSFETKASGSTASARAQDTKEASRQLMIRKSDDEITSQDIIPESIDGAGQRSKVINRSESLCTHPAEEHGGGGEHADTCAIAHDTSKRIGSSGGKVSEGKSTNVAASAQPWASIPPTTVRSQSSSPVSTGNRMNEAKASVHSISLDFGPQIGLSGSALREAVVTSVADSTWLGTFGSLLWTSTEPSLPNQLPSHVSGGKYDRAPAGSLGYVLHHMSSDICPPEPAAWEDILLARACAEISDAVIEQVVTLVVGLVEAAHETNCHPNSTSMGLFEGFVPDDMHPKEKSLMLSMIIAQLTSDLGLVSVEGRETVDWGVLVTSSASDLVKIINSKRTEGFRQKESRDSASTVYRDSSLLQRKDGVAQRSDELASSNDTATSAPAPAAGVVNMSISGDQVDNLKTQNRGKPTN